jgi:hypothetical protein
MDHINRLNRTIEYIEANLDKNIHLELLEADISDSKQVDTLFFQI